MVLGGSAPFADTFTLLKFPLMSIIWIGRNPLLSGRARPKPEVHGR